jgi:peptidoglycan-associated lipoprotein
MKQSLIKLTLALSVVLLLGACNSTPTKDDDSAAAAGANVEERSGGAGGASSGADGSTVTTMGVAGQGGFAGSAMSLDDPTSELATRTIYFDLDSSDIKPEFVAVLRAHAAYLLANPATRVTLEGHCDERGSREYNLALGERRARMVKRYIMAEGVGDAQLDELSYGEERPVDLGQGDAAWSQNRRVEIVY